MRPITPAENDATLLGLGQRIARAFRDQRTLFIREGRMSASDGQPENICSG
jgi:hypothetical protein